MTVLVERKNKKIAGEYTYVFNEPIAPGIRVRVPFGKSVITGLVTACFDEEPKADFEIRPVDSLMDEAPVISPGLMALARWVAHENIVPLIEVLKIMLPQGLKPVAGKSVRDTEHILLLNPHHGKTLTDKQQAFIDSLEFPVLHAEAMNRSSYMTARLKKDGVLLEDWRLKDPRIENAAGGVWPKLNDEQQKALEELKKQSHPISLLYGVTGSGKTEVFFHLMQKVLEQGKQVLLLVPEIALTPMMKKRIASRFKVPVYEYHSRLNPTDTLATYKTIASAGSCIVLGTRKACFLPFSNLGLMILDEEHDASYKSDTRPAYHAREVCIKRLEEFPEARIVLSSATPSLETAARAYKGNYGYTALNRRAKGSFCAVHLVDLNVEDSMFGLTAPVITALSNTLRKGRQAILLLNRRGYIPKMQCMDCKSFLVCDDCGLPLSWHKKQNVLVCHTCGKTFSVSDECPSCHSHNLRKTGIGTEKLEERLQSDFPSAHIVRMDRDTTSIVGGHEKLFNDFEKKGDILVGTQMVSKGIDFPRVDLTAIIGIDNAFFKGEYRSQEMAYQLAEQAAGRAGRGFSDARVLIQTYFPYHYIFEAIRRHDYWYFFKNEMAFRRNGHYPPYSFLAQVIVCEKDIDALEEKTDRVFALAEEQDVEVLGPLPISMRQKNKRSRILLRAKSRQALVEACWVIENTIGKESWAYPIEFNIEPMTLED